MIIIAYFCAGYEYTHGYITETHLFSRDVLRCLLLERQSVQYVDHGRRFLLSSWIWSSGPPTRCPLPSSLDEKNKQTCFIYVSRADK